MITLTGTHQWVKHVVTQIDVIADPEDDDAVLAITSQEAMNQAEEEATYGCSKCLLPLNTDNSETACTGAPA